MKMHNNKTYRKILEHRNNCRKWTKEFCLECFGGGLTRFLANIEEESRTRKKYQCIIYDEGGTWSVKDKEYSDETKETIKRIIKHTGYIMKQ